MLEQALHSHAVLESARGRTRAATGVFKQIDVRLESLLAIFATRRASRRDLRVNWTKGMRLVVRKPGVALGPLPRRNRLITILTKIEVGARITVVANAVGDIEVARTALLEEFRSRGIVQLKEYHHRRVLRSPEFVELAVSGLAVVQKHLSRLKQIAFERFILVCCIGNGNICEVARSHMLCHHSLHVVQALHLSTFGVKRWFEILTRLFNLRFFGIDDSVVFENHLGGIGY